MVTFKPNPAGIKQLEENRKKSFAEATRKGVAKTPAGEGPAESVATELEAIGVKSTATSCDDDMRREWHDARNGRDHRDCRGQPMSRRGAAVLFNGDGKERQAVPAPTPGCARDARRSLKSQTEAGRTT